MKTSSIALSVLTLGLALFAHQAAAVVPNVDGVGKPANISCRVVLPTTTTTTTPPVLNPLQPVMHFDKIIFAIVGQPGQFPLKAAPTAAGAVSPDDQKKLESIPMNTELDIKVVDDPRTVANLKGKILTFLGAVPSPDFYPAIRIISVEYSSVVCSQ
jgi:hypothetical protein